MLRWLWPLLVAVGLCVFTIVLIIIFDVRRHSARIANGAPRRSAISYALLPKSVNKRESKTKNKDIMHHMASALKLFQPTYFITLPYLFIQLF